MKTVRLSDIQIRNALAPGDLGYIAFLHGDIYAKECDYGLSFEVYVLDGLKDFACNYDPDKDGIWICEYDSKIIGSMIAQHRAAQIQLRYFIFLPEYRGLGLGKYLMQEFLYFMRDRNIKEAYLWTTDEQKAAIGLYEKFGFELKEESVSDTFGKKVVERLYKLFML